MLYNKEKTNEQVTAAKTRRDTKDQQLKAYLKELGVGIGCSQSEKWPNGLFLLLKYTNLTKMTLNFQMDQVVLRQKQSLHQRKGQRENQLTRQLLRDVLDERENVNYLRLCQDPFQIRKNQNNDFHLDHVMTFEIFQTWVGIGVAVVIEIHLIVAIQGNDIVVRDQGHAQSVGEI